MLGLLEEKKPPQNNLITTANARAVFMEGFAEGIRPFPDINVWEWADEHRVIAGEMAAEPGPYRTDRTPYCRAIMEALSPDSEAQIIVCMKATQLGLTEVANNWAMHTIALNLGSFAMYFPTDTDAAMHSKMKFQPSVEETEPIYKKLVLDARHGDNTVHTKIWRGGVLAFKGAESSRNYRHLTWKFIDGEEIDEWPYDVGGQGDPTELLIKRLDTQLQNGGKIYFPCSPTIDGLSKVQRWWERSNQQYYYVPCPLCGEYQTLVWRNLIYENDEDYNLTEEPMYECAHCKKKFMEHHKTAMLDAGAWRAHHPERVNNKVPGSLSIYGFGGLNSLYSPLGWVAWAQMAQEWLYANKDNDPIQRKTFINTRLADVWRESTETRDPGKLMVRREEYSAQVPMGACILVCGVDVQKDRLELTVIAWGPGFESWVIEHKVLRGDTSRDDVWTDLWSYIYDTSFTHESGLAMKIAGTCLDSSAFTDTVYAYARPHQGRRVFIIKGKGGDRAPISGPNKVFKKTINLFTIGTNTVKERIFGWLNTQKPEGHQPGDPIRGYCHFPLTLGQDYFDQLTGEVGKLEKGQKIFVPRRAGQPVEALDCFVYAYSVLKILDVDLDRRMLLIQKKAQAIREGKPVPTVTKKRRIRVKR